MVSVDVRHHVYLLASLPKSVESMTVQIQNYHLRHILNPLNRRQYKSKTMYPVTDRLSVTRTPQTEPYSDTVPGIICLFSVS